jgi:hypothetical protein
MKRIQLNIALATVAAGLGAVVFFSANKQAPKAPALTALKADAVEHIVVAHPGHPEIRLDKKAGSWMLTAPVAAEADPLEVNGILALTGMETRKTLDSKQVDKAELGLDPPAFTVTLNEIALQFGGVEPLYYQRYLETGSDLVSKALLPAGADIQKIEVPGLAVARSADGKAWEATPSGAAPTRETLQQFVDAWKSARALWMQLETGAPSGDAVTVTLKDRVLPLQIVSRDPQLVLYRPDLKLRYVLRKTDAGPLLKLPAPKAAAPADAAPAGQTAAPAVVRYPSRQRSKRGARPNPCPSCPKSKPSAAASSLTCWDGASTRWWCVTRGCAGRCRRIFPVMRRERTLAASCVAAST